MYSNTIVRLEYTQKLLTTGIELMQPERKASPFVNDVMVIEGPAWLNARFRRSSGDNFMEVQSMALQMTNMSSTPIPSIRIGKAECTSDVQNPKMADNPMPPATDKRRAMIPAIVALSRQWIGLQEPRTKIQQITMPKKAYATKAMSASLFGWNLLSQARLIRMPIWMNCASALNCWVSSRSASSKSIVPVTTVMQRFNKAPRACEILF